MTENNIAVVLDLLTQKNSMTDVNQPIAEKLFELDKRDTLNND